MKISKNLLSGIIIVLIFGLSISIISRSQLIKKVENLEKAIIMGEFSQLAKDWRNFNNFTKELAIEMREVQNPLNPHQIKGSKELGLPKASVILESRSLIIDSEYRHFINQFNQEFNVLYDRFFRSLPNSTADEIDAIYRAMDATYIKFISSGIWTLDQEGKNTIISFDMDALSEVLNEIIAIKNQLE